MLRETESPYDTDRLGARTNWGMDHVNFKREWHMQFGKFGSIDRFLTAQFCITIVLIKSTENVWKNMSQI